MRIDGEEGEDTSVLSSTRSNLLSPGASSANSENTDEMMDSENGSMRDRLQYLEKKVIDQTDEIMCLRSTLADALRRIATIESNRDSPQLMNETLSKTPTPPVRLRMNVSDRARDKDRRATSYLPGRTNGRKNHPGATYQSSSSLYSDGHSSSSASPAPSPSPTHHHSSSAISSNIFSSSNNNYRQNSSSSSTNRFSAKSTTVTSSTLSKRWNSTMDFSSTSKEPLTNGHSPLSSSSSTSRSPSAGGLSINHHNSNLTKKQNGGSLHNLANLRHSSGFTSVPSNRQNRREPQYLPDEGVVRVYIRGRPVTLYVPSHLRDTYTPTTPTPTPDFRLDLDWVYGYRGRDCRNNLQHLPTGELVYFVAAVAVLYNPEDQMQRHYTGHTDDIKCLSVHPNRILVATGQTAGNNRPDTRPHIRVWDSVSLNTLHILGISDFERSVSCLSFSRADGGALLVAVDDATDHNISLWEWSRGERGNKLLESKCSTDPVLTVEFSPLDRHTIITCGRNHITFWMHENGMLAKRLGVFETREKPKYVTSLAFLNTGDLLSGDSNGTLSMWYRGGNTVAHRVKGAHEGSVFSILVQNNGTIITAGKDGKVQEWDSSLNRTSNSLKIQDKYGSPRVVTAGKGRLVIGTTRNCLLAGSFSLSLQPIMLGHFDEVWAMASHPSQQQFLTGGYDKSCVLWDSLSHSQVWVTNFAEQVQCGCFSPNGLVVVVGGVSGYWAAMDATTRELREEKRDGEMPLQVVKFSPDGQYLAVGSRDGNIYIYQVMDNFTRYLRLGRCQGHQAAVLHVDWSTDSQYLQSNSTEYDVIYWNATTSRQIIQCSQLRDVTWATHTCAVSFNCLGTWQDDNVDVLTCSQGNTTDLVAAGDFLGNISLLRSPACYQKAQGRVQGGHGSLVTNVQFLPDDSRLVSCGSRDAAVMQWKVMPTKRSV